MAAAPPDFARKATPRVPLLEAASSSTMTGRPVPPSWTTRRRRRRPLRLRLLRPRLVVAELGRATLRGDEGEGVVVGPGGLEGADLVCLTPPRREARTSGSTTASAPLTPPQLRTQLERATTGALESPGEEGLSEGEEEEGEEVRVAGEVLVRPQDVSRF